VGWMRNFWPDELCIGDLIQCGAHLPMDFGLGIGMIMPARRRRRVVVRELVL